MRIVTYKRITEFVDLHPDSKTALHAWYYKSTKANWEYLNGKSEPTLKIARQLKHELGIDADIILG